MNKYIETITTKGKYHAVVESKTRHGYFVIPINWKDKPEKYFSGFTKKANAINRMVWADEMKQEFIDAMKECGRNVIINDEIGE